MDANGTRILLGFRGGWALVLARPEGVTRAVRNGSAGLVTPVFVLEGFFVEGHLLFWGEGGGVEFCQFL